VAESGIPYELVTPDVTIRFNEWRAAGEVVADVYQLTDVSGLVPEVRTSTRPRPHRHGIRRGRGLRGGMFPVLRGRLIHSGPEAQESMRSTLERAAYSILDTEGTLRWQPSTGDSWRRVGVYLNERPDVAGGLFKEFMLPLVAEVPYILGEEIKSEYTSFLAAGGGGGLMFPFTFPFDFVDPTSPGANVFFNAGDVLTWPTITIIGPVTNPVIRNLTTGDALGFDSLTLLAGETVVIDTYEETVFKNGDPYQSLDGALDIETSTFWHMLPGDNVISLGGSAPDPAVTRALVTWQDSYA
jgi:hypothetical protein